MHILLHYMQVLHDSAHMNQKLMARLFSRELLRQLAEGTGLAELREVAVSSGLAEHVSRPMNIGQVLDIAFDSLSAGYRNEYVYKNLIALQLMLDRHPPGAANLHSELNVYTSKADVVIVNGTSSAYEIKSELDNLDRLDKQLEDYQLVFDHTYVVTHRDCASVFRDRLPESVGLVLLEETGALCEIVPAHSNRAYVSVEAVFFMLRKAEYTAVLQEHFGYAPQVSNVHYMRTCLELFKQLTPTEAHDHMVQCLKQRDVKKRREAFARMLPRSLRHFGLCANLTQKQASQIYKVAQSPFLAN